MATFAHTYSMRQRVDGKFTVTHSWKSSDFRDWFHAHKTFPTRAAAQRWVVRQKEEKPLCQPSAQP